MEGKYLFLSRIYTSALFPFIHKLVVNFDRVGNLCRTRRNTPSTSNAGHFPDLLRHVFPFAIVAVAEPFSTITSEIVPTRHGGKFSKKAAVPDSVTLTFLQAPIDIIAYVEAVTCRTDQVARSAGIASLGFLLPDRMFIGPIQYFRQDIGADVKFMFLEQFGIIRPD